jgi:acetolactate synthase-1/2/3 large subunit
LAAKLTAARRPILWLGGGARGASAAVARLADMGIAVVTSVQGRGTLNEKNPLSLGAFNLQAPVEAFYATCDAMLVVGSRLRGNETFKYALRLPKPLYQIDADPAASGRNYPVDLFVAGNAALALGGLADRLAGRMKIDPAFARDVAEARRKAEAGLRETLGPYNDVVDALQAGVPEGFLWVRDITLSNTSWGNRLPRLVGPRDGVHALGGGIGQGLPMAIGAALAADGRKTVALVGDGGFQMTMGELSTAVETNADIAIVLMNDRGYGVIKNIQDAKFGGRKVYADLHTPDFGKFAAAIGVPYARVTAGTALGPALAEALRRRGPTLIEVDMIAVGPFARPFAGPPARTPKEKAG